MSGVILKWYTRLAMIQIRRRQGNEAERLAFLINRDGLESATQWACSTYKLYRKAVTNKNHFASKKGYRGKFIKSYCELKRFCYDQRPT